MAEPAFAPVPMTFEDAARLDPDRDPGDVVEGEWAPVSKNTYRHGQIVINVATLLRLYTREHREWIISGGDPGTKLRRDPDTLRGPGVAVVRRERMPGGRGAEGWLEGAPEIAVEVVGDGQSLAEILQKALDYLAAGAGLVWVLDPETQRVVVVSPPDRIRILDSGATLDGGEVLPGFSCAVSELFED